MATFSSHRLIMGIEEIDNFFCLIGDICNVCRAIILLSNINNHQFIGLLMYEHMYI